MSGFYERLGLSPEARLEEIQSAYHRGLARLVKKHRKAEASGADTAAIQAEKEALSEAHGVLIDPNRRRSYDHFLSLESDSLEQEANAFWEQIQSGMVEPGAAAALDVLRTLTTLPLGDAPQKEIVPMPPSPDFTGFEDPVPSVPGADVAQEDEPKLVIGSTAPQSAAEAQTFNTEAAFQYDRPDSAPAELQSRSLTLPELGALIEAHGYDGRLLSAVRQAKGLTMEAVASATNISTRYLQALETNAFDRLPSAIFVRGYLKEIARVLDLEPDALTEGYLGLYQRQRGA